MDPDARVRLEAAKRSGSQDALYKIALHGDDSEKLGLEALKYIKDEALIANLALMPPDYSHQKLLVKTEALKLIKNTDMLNSIISRELKEISRYIKDTRLYSTLYSSYLRYVNVLFGRIQDQNILVAVIEGNLKGDASDILCSNAVAAITDQDILAKLALKYMNRDFAKQAFEKITDESIRNSVGNEAKKIYESNEYDGRKEYCVKFIEDQDMLLEMVLSSKWDSVKTTALERINCQEHLVSLVKALPGCSTQFGSAFKKLFKMNNIKAVELLKESIDEAKDDDTIQGLAVIARDIHIRLEASQRRKVLLILERVLSKTPRYYSYTPGDDDWVVRSVPNREYIQLESLIKYYK